VANVIVTIDRFGALNAFQFSSVAPAGWAGPQLLNCPNLVPGSPVAVFAQSPTLYTALTIDSTGTLNIASFDASSGWQSLESIGETSFVPGAPIAVFSRPIGRTSR